MLASRGIQHCQGTTSVAGPTPCSVGADKVEGEGGVKESPSGGETGFSHKLPWMIIFLHKYGKWFKKIIGDHVNLCLFAGFNWLRFQQPSGASTPAGLDCGPGLASGTATASGAVGVVGVAAAEAGALATTLEMSISRFQ